MDTEFRLPTHLRVNRANNILLLKQTVNAHIAGDAPPNLLFSTFLDFLREIGIRYQPPGHGDDIGLSFFQDLTGQLRVVDSSRHNDRNGHLLFDRLCFRDIAAPGQGHGRDNPFGAPVIARRDINGIHTGHLHEPSDPAGICRPQPALHMLRPRDPKKDWKIVSYLPSHLLDDLKSKSASVLQTAAV